ncbi:MAG: GyrI-like domain-containing protein [Chloroflexi bacterium]|nr:GyrI-like domain-containing protein [Chloroflexota bacterium]
MGTISVKSFPDYQVIYQEFTGPARQLTRVFDHIASWMEQNGLKPSADFIGVFYAPPASEEPSDIVRMEACIPVNKRVKVSDPLRFKTLKGGAVVYTLFEIGSGDLSQAERGIFTWMAERHMARANFHMHLYRASTDIGKNENNIEILVPVR